jgi:hypothetical protein
LGPETPARRSAVAASSRWPPISPILATLSRLPPALDLHRSTAPPPPVSVKPSIGRPTSTGVRNLLDALRAGGPTTERLLFTSSTSVYAQHQGEWVDEDSPAVAEGFSGRCIRAGERLLWDSGWPAVAVRFGGIYGPGRTRLIDSVREGSATCSDRPAGLHQPHPPRRLRPGAGTPAQFLPDPEPLYVAVDDDPAPLDEVLSWLATNSAPRNRPVASQSPLKPGAGAIRRDSCARMRASKRCRNARLRASGFQFRYPSYRDGYTRAVIR